MPADPQELYKKYRPQLFKQVFGQDETVSILKLHLERGDLPHCMVFCGQTGTGKTTLARIVAKKLGCTNKLDLVELNCAEARGIDTVRTIDENKDMAPLEGKHRVYIMDECHRLTKDSQSALLKILEDTPPHVYFMLATTNEEQLLPAILSRGPIFKTKPLNRQTMRSLLQEVIKAEKLNLSAEVVDKITEVSEGLPRRALVILHKIIRQPRETQLRLVEHEDIQAKSQAIAGMLLEARSKWPDIAKILDKLEDDAETARMKILNYMARVLLSGKSNERARMIMRMLDRPTTEMGGLPGLVLCCYEIYSTTSLGV